MEGLTVGAYRITLTRLTEAEISAYGQGDSKTYSVTLTVGRSFCGCGDSMFHGKVCKHATALALYTIRHPTTETKGETQNDAPKPFNQKALAEKLADLNKAPYRELKKIAFRDFANRWLQTTPKER